MTEGPLPPTPLGLESRVWRDHVLWASHHDYTMVGDGDGPSFWRLLDELDEDEVLPAGLKVALRSGAWWETAWGRQGYGWYHREIERPDEADPVTDLRSLSPDTKTSDFMDDEGEWHKAPPTPSSIEVLKAKMAELRVLHIDPFELREALIRLRDSFTAPRTDADEIDDRLRPWADETRHWGNQILQEAVDAADEHARPQPQTEPGEVPLFAALLNPTFMFAEQFVRNRRTFTRARNRRELRAVWKRLLASAEQGDVLIPFMEGGLNAIAEEMRAEGMTPPEMPDLTELVAGPKLVPGKDGRPDFGEPPEDIMRLVRERRGDE